MAYLTLSNISKAFGGGVHEQVLAVRDFDMEIQKGELVSFLGPSGCGKTTTLRMVAGFERPTTGVIILEGEDITDKSPNQRNVGMVFQSYALFPNMTVGDNIGFGLKIAKESPAEVKQRVNEMLDLIHMPEYGNRYPYQLSGGQQQRVALARALALKPDVLLLDEPLSALDAKIRVSLRSEIRAIQKQLGITAIYVTHDQEEAMSISDRIVIMNKGEVEQIGTPFEIYNFPTTVFTANFVGTLNTVDGEIDDPVRGVVTVDGVKFESDSDLKDRKKGDKVRVAIRPERFNFVSHGKKTNVLDCKIENINFLGSIVRIQVMVANTKFYVDTFNNPVLDLPNIGDRDQITCSRKAVLVLAD
ncbi:MAG: ABC transporter ATP-binding protein [Anaerolineaceae bacterium]|nr:MAG: ABC transporter ATP-binding protein [Anaerolineaceae bacterium]